MEVERGGPRYLLPAIAGLCAVTGLLEGKGKKVLILLTAAGFLLTVPTMFSFYERYLSELTAQGLRFPRSLHGPCPALRFCTHGRLHFASYVMLETATCARSSVNTAGLLKRLSRRALRVVAVCWWVLPAARVPRWPGFLITLLLTITGVWLIMRCRTEAGCTTSASSDLALSGARG